jgi:uncharacterized membrane protein
MCLTMSMEFYPHAQVVMNWISCLWIILFYMREILFASSFAATPVKCSEPGVLELMGLESIANMVHHPTPLHIYFAVTGTTSSCLGRRMRTSLISSLYLGTRKNPSLR